MERIKEIARKYTTITHEEGCGGTGIEEAKWKVVDFQLTDETLDKLTQEITTYIIGEVSKLPTMMVQRDNSEITTGRIYYVKRDDVENMLKGEK